MTHVEKSSLRACLMKKYYKMTKLKIDWIDCLQFQRFTSQVLSLVHLVLE